VSVEAEKAALRRAMRDALAALGEAERTRRSGLVVERASALRELGVARTLLVFRSLATEVATEGLLSAALARSQRVYAPRIDGSRLVFLRVGPQTRWRRAATLPIEEPEDGEPLSAAELASPSAVAIVPGLAFSERGDRLGRGGGHYDRALGAASRAGLLLVGLAFDLQVHPEIPTAPHDVPADVVVTESRTLRRASA
jgi:5-formyltetrahydrofolate cyclo-ligase